MEPGSLACYTMKLGCQKVFVLNGKWCSKLGWTTQKQLFLLAAH